MFSTLNNQHNVLCYCSSAVIDKFSGWLAGCSAKFDSQKSKMAGNNFALGYATGDLVFHTNVYVLFILLLALFFGKL